MIGFAASGDSVGFDWASAGPVTVNVTITGGTGRFEGATGEFTLDVQVLSSEIVWPYMTINYLWKSSGTISY